MSLTVSESTQGQALVIHTDGFIDTATCNYLESSIKKAFNEKNFKIIVNLQKTDFISSAGWGVFVAFLKKFRTEGGDIKLCCMVEKVEKVYRLMEFDGLIDSYATVDEALKSF